jgi:hypothetical protein
MSNLRLALIYEWSGKKPWYTSLKASGIMPIFKTEGRENALVEEE